MRLVLDARARAFLRRVPVTKVYTGVELLLIALLAVQCARLVWAVLTPVGPVGVWRPEQGNIAAAPQAILRGFDPFFLISGGDAAGPSVVTTLQLTLFGTRLDEAQGGGSAIIAGPDGVQQSIGVGQEIMPGVRLKAVAFDHVTIDRGGASEDLFLVQPDQAPAAAPVPNGPPLIGGNGAAPPVGPPAPGGNGANGVSFGQIKSDIGFIPRIDQGRVNGMTVRSQGGGAAFRAAGLRDGDVVTQIGGRPVSGQADIERIGAQYAKGGTLSITVERGGATLPLAITIAGP
ncbi:type II secretion system protein N [Sphingomonas sp. HMP6]|uniref:type II secretion system protein N n=1 Tax=Sphingomonas sp. HMP6 TaxID=1517551 RepID=UPI001596AFD5|nr:type II secretion system protein N [Sphingomonas sp. HMP6]BCA58383.1 type II secretory pathway component PulC [Sphingomonas sp. HMP6]